MFFSCQSFFIFRHINILALGSFYLRAIALYVNSRFLFAMPGVLFNVAIGAVHLLRTQKLAKTDPFPLCMHA